MSSESGEEKPSHPSSPEQIHNSPSPSFHSSSPANSPQQSKKSSSPFSSHSSPHSSPLQTHHPYPSTYESNGSTLSAFAAAISTQSDYNPSNVPSAIFLGNLFLFL